MNLTQLSKIQKSLLAEEYSVTDILRAYLDNINSTKEYNAYVEVFEEEALEKARALEIKIKSDPNSLGNLFGAVISIKDNLCYEGHKVSAGSKMLENYISPFSSTIVERLLSADAIIVGRTNCDEMSMGSTNESSYFGPTLNAVDKTKVPGGSSGGGAVSVKLQTCLAAIGSDTGGSIRQPAAFNGIVGFKPTYGLISRWGLVAYGSSFDQIGTLTHNIEDAAKILSVIAGPDEYDSTAIQQAPVNFNQLSLDKSVYKVAYIESMTNHPSLKQHVKDACSGMIKKIQNHGITVEPVAFELTDLLVPAYYILTTAEASSNLSRFDGIRFGHRSEKHLDDYRALIRASRTEGFGFEVKKRIMLGTYVLSEGYYEAYFKKAQQVRQLIKQRIEAILDKYDFILTPTTTDFAWPLGESKKDPLEMYLSDVFTVLANLSGIPAISLPISNNSSDLPLGIQLMTNQNNDRSLLTFANEILTLA